MADLTYTRCPGCATVFRVTAEQLALREGQVRCGHCRAVFDANDHLLSLDERDDDAEQTDELARGRPTITLRSADALQPLARPEKRREASDERGAIHAIPETDAPPGPQVGEATRLVAAEAEIPATEPDHGDANAASVGTDSVDGEATVNVATGDVDEQALASRDVDLDTSASPATGDVVAANAAASEPIDVHALDRAGRFEWKPRRSLTERPKALRVAAIALLLVALGLQLVFEYRDALAARVPASRPLLQHACDVFGCAIGPLRDAAALSIDASDLQADPAHKGLLLLSATIRNRAAYPIAYPHLELTLTDASDQVVVRRAFAPADYLGGTAIPSAGIAGNGEALVRLFIDASATAQAGYRLYLFYP